MAPEEESKNTGSCFCGVVVVTVDAGVKGTCSLCHCSICRKLSGAPFMASVVLPSSAVETTGPLADLKTSKRVTRQRCADCGSPVGATLGKGLRAVPLALFPTHWQPQHHIHYADRIFDLCDGLPKFAHRYGGPTCDDRGKID